MPKSDKNTGTILIAVGLGCMVLCGCGLVAGVGGWLIMAPKQVAPVAYPTGGGDGVASRITGLYQTGGSGEWDNAVAPIMTGAYDHNGSGAIDTSSEVRAVPCAVWHALDAGVLQSWDYGVRTIYGFEADYSWVGGAIGFSETVRAEADALLVVCLSGAAPAPVPVPRPPTGGAGGPVAQQIRSIAAEGGGSAWDDGVEVIILGAYDTNKSGAVDTQAELSAIPCDVWRAMDDGVHVKWDYGLRTIYGFDGIGYLGGEIGFGPTMMGPGATAMIGCGIGE